jgi:ribosomal protein L12E/L44/L45/RPP1/RPP2
MTDLPLAAQVDLWRQKALSGTITDEELKEAVKALRSTREAAAVQGAKKKALAPVRDASAILGLFGSK